MAATFPSAFFHSMYSAVPLRVLGCLSVLLFGSLAFGDGCYIPERAVRKIPEISAQRAILSWKEGKETLVISSALSSESQKLGWIIPLPAVPENIEKQSPGGLKTLNFCIQPKITHDLHHSLVGMLLPVFLGNLILATALFKREYLVRLLVLLLLIFIFYSLLLSAGSGPTTAAKSNSLSVEKSVAAGSYDVHVLKASRLADLNGWLAENGFSSLPEAADRIVEDYLSKGWVFAAIKLARAESGANAPHPIKMQFASKEPVYPLKLTSIAGGSPQFEIFVIADQKASCDAIPEEFCDRFMMTKTNWDSEYEPETAFTSECETKAVLVGEDSSLRIGHPAIQKLMWDRCVLTKFSGTIDAEKMVKDLQFEWIPFKAYRKHFYTINGAFEAAIISFVGAAGIWVFVSMILFKRRIRALRGPLWYFGVAVVPVFAVFAITTFAGYMRMPKLADSEVSVSRRMHASPPYINFDVIDLLEEYPNIFQRSEQEIVDAIAKYRTNNKTKMNEITGSELKQEDSPGNFTVDSEDGRNVIRVYDYDGSVWAIGNSGSSRPTGTP